MPEAHARRRREDEEVVEGPDRVRLRLVDSGSPPGAGTVPMKPHPRARASAPDRGRDSGRRAQAPPGATVRITGQSAPPRRRSPAASRTVARPDRVAMWAVGLGLFMAFMAAATSRADTGKAAPVAPPGVVHAWHSSHAR